MRNPQVKRDIALLSEASHEQNRAWNEYVDETESLLCAHNEDRLAERTRFIQGWAMAFNWTMAKWMEERNGQRGEHGIPMRIPCGD